jgi:hypothetical protein
MQTPQEHFSQLELIFYKHAQALEAEVRALQITDETSQWPTAWKKFIIGSLLNVLAVNEFSVIGQQIAPHGSFYLNETIPIVATAEGRWQMRSQKWIR